MNASILMSLVNSHYGRPDAAKVLHGEVRVQEHQIDDFTLVDIDAPTPSGLIDAGPYQLLWLALNRDKIPEDWKKVARHFLFKGIIFDERSKQLWTEGCWPPKSMWDRQQELESQRPKHWVPCMDLDKERGEWEFSRRHFLSNSTWEIHKRVCFHIKT